MDLNPKIKKLVDDTPEDLFSNKKWIRNMKPKVSSAITEPIITIFFSLIQM
ncbi:MAG: hypothetical protein QF693_04960 [Pelagibacteraceae bacterium]|jgi:hypothetical protein|nr:hypothetical protein [Pelagibacteraceae bacterium]|tara:strand:- start:1296 stop:1448 length:153 start_codon:yes stop_codon:yes gene_type:complete